MIAETINNISSIVGALTDLIPKIIGFASVAAAFLPKPDGEGIMSRVHKYINAVAFNIKHAANAE